MAGRFLPPCVLGRGAAVDAPKGYFTRAGEEVGALRLPVEVRFASGSVAVASLRTAFIKAIGSKGRGLAGVFFILTAAVNS